MGDVLGRILGDGELMGKGRKAKGRRIRRGKGGRYVGEDSGWWGDGEEEGKGWRMCRGEFWVVGR